jgi:hypothetical protein
MNFRRRCSILGMKNLLLLCGLFLSAPLVLWGHPEVIEIGRDNTADLPPGKEADGIIGDFVLRNDQDAKKLLSK